jgi:hypothetical protein
MDQWTLVKIEYVADALPRKMTNDIPFGLSSPLEGDQDVRSKLFVYYPLSPYWLVEKEWLQL